MFYSQYITEPDALLAAADDKIKAVEVVKDGEVFYIKLQMAWMDRWVYICTVRNPKEPRRFKNATTMMEFIAEHFRQVKKINLAFHAPKKEPAKGTVHTQATPEEVEEKHTA